MRCLLSLGTAVPATASRLRRFRGSLALRDGGAIALSRLPRGVSLGCAPGRRTLPANRSCPEGSDSMPPGGAPRAPVAGPSGPSSSRGTSSRTLGGSGACRHADIRTRGHTNRGALVCGAAATPGAGTIPAAPGHIASALLLRGNAGSIASADYSVSRGDGDDSSGADVGRVPGGENWREPLVIGVAGGTASGKTSVVASIVKQLQQDVGLEHHGILSISQDCFYRDLTPKERDDIAAFNFDHPSAFAFPEIIESLKALKSGQPADIPQYDFVTSARKDGSTRVLTADVIVFDGILAFHDKELRDLYDMKIFVDADADTRLARRMRRDIVERGRDVLQVLDQYEGTVKPSFENYIAPTKKYADVIVPRGADNHVAIDLIYQHIRMRLMQRS